MKLFTLILATTILFLSLKPGIDLISLPSSFEQGCCSGKCTPLTDFDKLPDQQPKGDCDRNGCNPFQRCCSSVLFCFEIPFIDSLKLQITSKKNFIYQPAHYLLVATDFWQPPKFV